MNVGVKFVVSLSTVSLLNFLGFTLPLPILPSYALSFGVSIALASWAISAHALARIFLEVPAGMLGDRYGKKKIMILGLIFLGAASLVVASAPNFPTLILGRGLMGMASALYVTSASAWLAEFTTGGNRGEVMGMYSTIAFTGASLGPLIGGYVASWGGLRAPFYLYSLMTLFGLLIALRLPSIDQRKIPRPRGLFTVKGVTSILLRRSFLIVGAAGLSFFIIRTGCRTTLIPLYSSLNLGLDPSEIGLLLTLIGLPSSLLMWPSGWLSDRVGRRRPLMIGLFTSSLIILFIPHTEDLGQLYFASFILGLASGLQGPISAYAADVSPKDRLGTGIGLFRVLTDIGFITGPLIAGYTAEAFSPSTITPHAFYALALIATLGGILLVAAKDPVRTLRRGGRRPRERGR